MSRIGHMCQLRKYNPVGNIHELTKSLFQVEMAEQGVLTKVAQLSGSNM